MFPIHRNKFLFQRFIFNTSFTGIMFIFSLLVAQCILRNDQPTTELPKALMSYVDSQQPSLWTVLHHAAASRSADRQVLHTIIQSGAFLSLKTQCGETAYDVAAAREREDEVINILKVPGLVFEIDRMESALRNIIRERSQFFIEKHSLQLPQISVMWEMKTNGLETFIC